MSEAEWIALISKHLVGKKIARIEYMSGEEADDYGWYSRPVAIGLDDGTWLVPMSDDEGNDGGAITTTINEIQTIPVL